MFLVHLSAVVVPCSPNLETPGNIIKTAIDLSIFKNLPHVISYLKKYVF